MAQSKEPRYHWKGKHIEGKYFSLCEIVKRGDVTIEQIFSTVLSLLMRLVEVCWD